MASSSVKQNNVPDNDEFVGALSRRFNVMLRLADAEEESRRRSDRIGANIFYGRHWSVPMPKNRAALTINVAKSLVDHKVAIMTKQLPIPVVEATDVGDAEAARLMRFVLMEYWRSDRMMVKSRDALKLANTTRTVAAKTYWDLDKKGGAGDVTTDIIPGYRLILDPRTKDVDRMEFIGDRAWMPRTRAMKMYPQAADKINEAGAPTNSIVGPASSADSPIETPWKRSGVDTASAGGALVNGKPVITAFTGRAPINTASDDSVEIVEMYYRDRTLVEKEVPVEDSLGNPIKKLAIDPETGAPKFEQNGDWDDILGEPGFTLVYENVTKIELVPKYPFYRRTTKIYPDDIVIDDCAWDQPHPYEIYGDQRSLEGPWDKGSILEVEDLQATLNISASTMLDNLRFSAFRAFKKTSSANIQKNSLVISPGDVIDVGQSQDGLLPLEFPELSQAWFPWLSNIISMMERIIGATGVMQGEATGRVDSANGYDMLAEIGGSRIVECTQRFEEWISRIMMKVGWYAQRYYTEKHAVRVENAEGELTWQRVTHSDLMGSFNYKIVMGSTLAWNESSVRARTIEEYQLGLRDKPSVWQKLQIEGWQDIKRREQLQDPSMNAPPPPRTRQSFGAKGKKPNAPRPR